MNPFDILIIIILSFCLIRGMFRGLVKELSSIIGVIGGFYAAYTYYRLPGPYIIKWIANPAYRNIICFLFIFCATVILISLIGTLIRFLLKITFLAWFDRLCGASFGAVKGILIVSVLLTMFTAFLPKDSAVIRNSILSPYVTAISEEMSQFITAEMKQNFADNMKGLKKSWEIRK